MNAKEKAKEHKYNFFLHDGSLLYSCDTLEKKIKYESSLKSKRVKYILNIKPLPTFND